MEGLAILPDGFKLYGMMQYALIQDGVLDASLARVGLNNRIVAIDGHTSAEKRPVVSWIEPDRANFAGTMKSLPVREELNEPAIREQYVVEYYSR
jgi:ribosomal protein S4